MTMIEICKISDLEDRQPKHFLIENLNLVVIRYDDNVSVLYGRGLHRGALLADGYIKRDNLICGLYKWDYRIDTGISEYNNDEVLYKFTSIIKNDRIMVDENDLDSYKENHPQPFKREEYLGQYAGLGISQT